MKSYRTDIDGLRAVAVIPVVLFHAGFLLFSGGFVGVDVFFVISGYLITGGLVADLDKGRYSIAQFYVRRIRRIFPAYFALVLAVSILAVLVMLPADLIDLGKSMTATSIYASNIFFWQESGDYFGVKSEFQPLLHTWSLAVEEQFYIFFPILLLLAARIRHQAFLLTALVLTCLASLALSIYATSAVPVASFYLLPTRAWELLAGSLIAVGAFRSPPSKSVAQGAGVLGLLLILVPVFVYTNRTPFPGLAALPPVLGAGLILYAGTAGHETAVARLLSLPPARFFGLISYSLYLWHWPIIVFFRYYFIEITPAQRFLLLFLATATATLSWAWIERPFRLSSFRISARPLFLTTAALTVTVAASGLFLGRDGLPGRLDPALVRMADKSSYQGPPRRCGSAFARERTIETLCTRGTSGASPDFLIVGDSHADAVAQAIVDAAQKSGRAGYQITDTAYRPLIGYEKIGEEEKYRYLNKLVLALLESHRGIKRVIVTLYWQQAVNQDRYRNNQGADVSGAEGVFQGLLTLVQRYPERQFLILLSPPHSLSFGANAFGRASWYGKVSFRPFVTRSAFDAEQASYLPIAARLALQPNVHLLPVSDKLCDAVRCRGFIDDQPAYTDDNHISYAASKLLEGDFQNFLK